MFNKFKFFLTAIATLLAFNSAIAMGHKHSTNHHHDSVTIDDPWVRSAPPNAPALGAFMNIVNNTHQALKLIKADADGYDRIELHRTQQVGDLMKMVKQAFMPIPAMDSLLLKPGSWHVMLIGPDSVPKEGEKVRISLYFDNGEKQTVSAVVRKGQKMMHHNHNHH